MEHFSEILKNARLAQRKTQMDVALELGVEQHTICNWESGRRFPDTLYWVTLSELLFLPLLSIWQGFVAFRTRDSHSSKSELWEAMVNKIRQEIEMQNS